MSQYINKTKIEEILRSLWKKDDGSNPEHRICYNKALGEVQCELDTIEAKEVDLEMEFNDYIEKHNAFINNDNSEIKYYNDDSFNHDYDVYPIAEYFFELGLNAGKEE